MSTIVFQKQILPTLDLPHDFELCVTSHQFDLPGKYSVTRWVPLAAHFLNSVLRIHIAGWMVAGTLLWTRGAACFQPHNHRLQGICAGSDSGDSTRRQHEDLCVWHRQASVV